MTAKPTRRVKRTGKKVAVKMSAIGVMFLGLLVAVEQTALAVGMTSVPLSTISATAAFIAGIATERYIL